MEEPKKKYILLVDRVGNTYERTPFGFNLPSKVTLIQVLRGELLEAIPEAEQPSDVNRVALVGIYRKSLRLECCRADLTRLSDEEANLLLAISSAESTYETFIDKKRLNFGRRLLIGNRVFVSVKEIAKDLPGVVWYKGELPSYTQRLQTLVYFILNAIWFEAAAQSLRRRRNDILDVGELTLDVGELTYWT